jgi:GTP-binding protein
MKILTTEFIKSSKTLNMCPKADFPEYAFIGRSNVGKSSLINMICDKKNLAKTSETPGKTQLINHFLINGTWYIVDLPGYGFAKSSKENRENWLKMIEQYLQKRKSLMLTFLLIDSRLKPQANDTTFMEWLGKKGLPFYILFTKTDKLKPRQLEENIDFYKNQMLQSWEELPPFICTSAENKIGKDEILKVIEDTNQLFSKQNS